MPRARGIESVTSCVTRSAACWLPRAGTTTASCSTAPGAGGGHLRELAAADRGGQLGDHPALALPVQRGQLGDGHGTGIDDVRQHPAGADRGQLRRIAHEQQPGAVRARLDQRRGELGVQHRGLVHHHEIGVDRPLLAPGEHPGLLAAAAAVGGIAPAAALRSEQPVQRGRGRAGQFLQPLGRPAGGRGEGDPQAALGRQRHDRGDRAALARPRAAREHAHPVIGNRGDRPALRLVELDGSPAPGASGARRPGLACGPRLRRFRRSSPRPGRPRPRPRRPRPLPRLGACLVVPAAAGPVQRLRRGGQPGQALRDRLLGEGVAGKGQQDRPAAVRGGHVPAVRRLPGSSSPPAPASPSAAGMSSSNGKHGAVIDRGADRRGRVVHAEPADRPHDHVGGHRRVAVPRGPGEHVRDDRTAAPRVLRLSLVTQQLAGEPVRLVGPDLRQREQQPRVVAEPVAALLPR